MTGRFSCRVFRGDPRSPKTIRRILHIAQRTPSWRAPEPWQVGIVIGRGLDRLRATQTSMTREVVPPFRTGLQRF
nr:nitroreductase family protein [Pacificitalea manganoxidans]